MRIGIIGLGYVGSAVAWAHSKHDLIIRDPKLKDSAELEQFKHCDTIFVCLPSPSTVDGHCDTSILEQGLEELYAVLADSTIPVISKTTAPPSVYARLQVQYPTLVHSPEFLTAANHLIDYAQSRYFIFGGDATTCWAAINIIQDDLARAKFVVTDIKTASLYKYMMNSYLAAKVTFMNDFAALACAEGVDWQKLVALTSYDNRIGHTHLSVPGPDGKYGWGGACFPKDVAAIIHEALDLGIDFELLQRVESINKQHRNKP